MQLQIQRRQFLSAALASSAACLLNSHHLTAADRPARQIKEVQYRIFRGNVIKLLKFEGK